MDRTSEQLLGDLFERAPEAAEELRVVLGPIEQTAYAGGPIGVPQATRLRDRVHGYLVTTHTQLAAATPQAEPALAGTGGQA
jgi:hypothetical protein